MSPVEMREHLLLPVGSRLLVRHRRLLDLAQREDLRRQAKPPLTSPELTRYRKLSSYAECKAFLAARQALKRKSQSP